MSMYNGDPNFVQAKESSIDFASITQIKRYQIYLCTKYTRA